MKLIIDCPKGKYNADMQIICEDGQPCAFQYFRACKGWWALSHGAGGCERRKETTENGNATVKRNKKRISDAR